VSPEAGLTAQSEFDGTIHLYDAASGKRVHTLKGHTVLASPLVFGPGGRRLFSRGYDGTVRVWDVAAGKELHKFTGGSNSSGGRLVVSPDGRLVAMASRERGAEVVRLWDAERGRELHHWTAATRMILGLAFAPDGSLLAVAGGDGPASGRTGTVTLWDTQTGAARRTLAVPEMIFSVAFSADGRMLATGGKTIRLWEIATGKERHALGGDVGGIYTLAFSEGGRHLASASQLAPVLVWDIYGREKGKLPAAQSLWDDLEAADAGAGFGAVRCLVAHPAEAVALCRTRLRPAPAADTKRVRQLIADLGSKRFAVRQQASTELKKIAGSVEPMLRKALRETEELEVKQRLAQVLEAAAELGPERLRKLRAVEVLERVATPDAGKLLRELAGGAASAPLTRAAAAAQARLLRAERPRD
jgi:hypothetical protein